MFPEEIISEVSPQSLLIRRTAKLPMFVILVGAGLIGGIATTFYKIIGELAIENDLTKDGWFVVILLLVGILANLIMLYLINIAMKYYDQLEVIPVFASSQLVFIILSGLILLDEYSLYKDEELVGLAIGVAVCAVGVFILLVKNKVKKASRDITSHSHDYYAAENEIDEQRKRLLKLLSTL